MTRKGHSQGSAWLLGWCPHRHTQGVGKSRDHVVFSQCAANAEHPDKDPFLGCWLQHNLGSQFICSLMDPYTAVEADDYI